MTDQEDSQTQRGNELGLPTIVRNEVAQQLGQQFGEVEDKNDMRMLSKDWGHNYSVIASFSKTAGLVGIIYGIKNLDYSDITGSSGIAILASAICYGL